MRRKYWIMGGAALLLLFLLAPGAVAAVEGNSILNSAAELIADYEGFRASPYWDVSRYSWGYGTAAPGATGSISESQAYQDLKSVVISDYNTLAPLLTRTINTNQWAALLDFSYNLGIGSAKELVPYINAGNDAALQAQWNLYVHAGGVVNADLVDRRGYEWQIWTG